jgi:hypothetical protein
MPLLHPRSWSSGSSVRAKTEAAESLKAQLNSQSKLPTPRRKNQKIRHENELLKGNEHDPCV